MNQHLETLAEALLEVEGGILSSVDFVHDYVQLRFGGRTMAAYTLPAITWAGSSLGWEQPGYRDALFSKIGQRVVRAESRDEAVSFSFEDGAVLSISLRERDYKGPEALRFSTGDGRIWVA